MGIDGTDVVKLSFRMGCAISVLGLLLAVLLYPRAKWLFGFALVGVVILIFSHLLAKDSTPEQLASRMERLLDGNCSGWDVDDFEHENISNPQLRELWQKSFEIGGLPEDWGRLEEDKKNQLREIVYRLRNLGD